MFFLTNMTVYVAMFLLLHWINSFCFRLVYESNFVKDMQMELHNPADYICYDSE